MGYHFSLLAFLTLSTATAALTCPRPRAVPVCLCGYRDSNGNTWRESIVSDFTQPAGALAAIQKEWIISAYRRPQTVGPKIDIQYATANVMQHDDALGLKASAYDGSGAVTSAEIFTNRKDIEYGSFRMRAVVPTVPGVVFGFFSYITDTQEQDIEFLSSDSDYYQRIHYTNHPGQLPGGGGTDTAAAKNIVVPGADFTAFGEHRFDWLSSETKYYHNGAQTASIMKNVPTTPSQIILNIWSNGDPGFSKGLPTADAIATVQHVKLYFNSTSLSESQFISTCNAAGNVPTCVV